MKKNHNLDQTPLRPLLDQCIALIQQGALSEAITLATPALHQPPAPDELTHWRKLRYVTGLALHLDQQPHAACPLLAQAVQDFPDHQDIRLAYGQCLLLLGLSEAQPAQALTYLHEAQCYLPNDPLLSSRIGTLLHEQANTDHQPGYAGAALSSSLAYDARLAEAEQQFRHAIHLAPGQGDYHNQLAMLLHDLNRLDEAEQHYRDAIALNPQSAESWNNLGTLVKARGDFTQAEQCYQTAIRLQPEHPGYYANLAFLYLVQGDFERGWFYYDWQQEGRPAPAWAGKTVHIRAEEGLGDQIHFVRYARELKARGVARLVWQTEAPLVDIFRSVPWIDEVCTTLPTADADTLELGLMSLPYHCQTRLDTIPADVPYLHPDPQRLQHWQTRLDSLCPRESTGGQPAPRRIGLVWSGNPQHPNNPHRSLALAQLAPLASVPNCVFFSLQKGEPAQQATHPPAGMTLHVLGDDIHDFADTAAILSQLDLLISVDSSPVHLAGALNLPCWVLLSSIIDWRWFLQRSDSPWYPSLTLFRQSQRCDWSEVIQRVANQLTASPLTGLKIWVQTGGA